MERTTRMPRLDTSAEVAKYLEHVKAFQGPSRGLAADDVNA